MNNNNKNFPTGFDLWQQVCTTDPRHTKKVNQRGGFTAINATYQMRQATEVWGSYGSTWGVKDCNYEYLRDGSGEIKEIILEAVFYYPSGQFEISTDARYSPGQDCRKKVLTDLTTKALSKLGFSADVFLGLYDDNKYINQVQAMFQKPENPASVKGAGVNRPKLSSKAFNTLVDRIKGGEKELIQKAAEMFVLSKGQQKILEDHATEV
jgi:hypothetical protein